MSKEENDAALEFMRIVQPVVDKAGEIGILDTDTMEFTEGFQKLVSAHPDTIQLHAVCVLVIDEWLQKTNQKVPDELKAGLALFVFGTMIDARCQYIEGQYTSLVEELQKQGVLRKKVDGK